MLKIEDLKGLNTEERRAKLTEDIQKYQAEVKDLTLEKLQEEENKVMDEFKIYDAYIRERTYTLPREVNLDGDVTRKASDVRSAISYFLSNVECTWQTTLGVYQAIVFWNNVQPNDTVPYGAYDSTIRLLGTLKYKGKKELEDILAINNYLAPAHDEYMFDLDFQNYLSAIHESIRQPAEALEKAMAEVGTEQV